ncbi:helix-turn-helix domain-containing protein [Paenibacillus glacialis]|uniref:HTH cro/C1-type domain-containing protein n=1 Tax=Paenibacillus glacialis TaxID=494026 RepID=A0A168DG17_9BACL|nr:helix-turn-helix transcriptional regulator [Paenibacillus glacialis]OAB34164.1 hypothetical protein PGLA_25045 [Paenibacillus glacialis]
MDIFAKRLKAERENLKRRDSKWTQEYIADLIGVARSTYTAYENGTKLPPMDTLNKIADQFEVSADFLMGRTGNPRPQVDGIDAEEQAEFEAFINNPQHGIFFKDYLSAPEERREEMRQIFKILQEKEKGRKPGDRQGE